MIKTFSSRVREVDESYLFFDKLETLQVNLGNLCNQRCAHCHVDAAPDSRNIMSIDVIDDIINFFKNNPGLTLDITGGAPEMNPHFMYFAGTALPLVSKLMVRTNLTIFFEKGYERLPDWYSKNKIVLIASMPCYTESNVDNQRGKGVFMKSIKAIKMLNERGYGKSIELNLVYNPGGPALPADQHLLEKDYKDRLYANFGIFFNYLFTITNAPIGRFGESLKKSDEHNKYLKMLEENFNPHAAGNIMCRSIISVDWQGMLYNCDFNQAKRMPILDKDGREISIIEIEQVIDGRYPIVTGDHCYSCTAGAGSCCTGALVAG